MIFSPCEKTRASLSTILAAGEWIVSQASTEKEAAEVLDRVKIGVVIAAEKWREFLSGTVAGPGNPSVIVTTPFADEALWAEVLNLGGYDLLVQPFEPNEVVRIVQGALRHTMTPRRKQRAAQLTAST